jgi:GH15 family glucan-1,4-alpha-glucosidase
MKQEETLAIDSYGLIGNMQTSAHVGTNGSIDWCCFPYFNSPSIFAKILDQHKGGHFAIQATASDATSKQHYWPDTNVLVTRFLSEEGIGQVVDFMPVMKDVKAHAVKKSESTSVPTLGETKRLNWLVRKLECVHGSMSFNVKCIPAFNYARDEHTAQLLSSKSSTSGNSSVLFKSKDLNLVLHSSHVNLSLDQLNKSVDVEFSITEGQSVTFVLKEYEENDLLTDSSNPFSSSFIMNEYIDLLLHSTIDYWHNWLEKCTYQGRWREMVHRSVLVLKLMTFEPTGAIIASPTCSLPEDIGGVRNWDYRYTWIRDASFTLYIFLRIGFKEEATNFIKFLEARCKEMHAKFAEQAKKGMNKQIVLSNGDVLTSPPPLQVMYGIDGSHILTEQTLDHLEGYRDSKPVRIGNGAYDQLQLDIYGELMDSMYIYDKHGSPISYDIWVFLRDIINWVCDNWNTRDEGIWEVRGGKQHFIYSKVMCWVAIDRGIRIAQLRSFPCEQTRWIQVRDQIYESVIQNGYNRNINAFSQYYGSETLDASTLILPLVKFVAPNDPMMLNTINAINRPPEQNGLVSSSLVYRYDASKTDDGFAGSQEGTFSMCTFFLIEALTRASISDPNKLHEAHLMFEQMLTYSNHLGLYSEEISFSGIALGNFPQAFTHIQLISAAFNLNNMLNKFVKWV